jgi:hypothetical protein
MVQGFGRLDPGRAAERACRAVRPAAGGGHRRPFRTRSLDRSIGAAPALVLLTDAVN